MNNKTRTREPQTQHGLGVLVLAIIFLLGVKTSFLQAVEVIPTPLDTGTQQEIDQLNSQIDAKRKAIDDLRRQTGVYERMLLQKQDERTSLQGELQELTLSIQQTENAIALNTTELDELRLQIQKVEKEIAAREREINTYRDELGGLLRQVYAADQVSQLELVINESTFSGFFTRIQNLHALSGAVRESLDSVVEVKRKLDQSKEELVARRRELDEKRQQLESIEQVLSEQESYKSSLVEAAQSSEEKYEQLIQELQKQAGSVDAEIESLIKDVNSRLQTRGQDLTQVNPGQLSWPVDPSRGITAFFHDPSYPFRHVFEHPAVDIRAYHGTEITAAADGVVAIARKLDWVKDSDGRILWPAYNFITIVHGSNISTVYGHLSAAYVTEGQIVRRGEAIGKTGATPGTAGAGRLTTGPHLHFEVRISGIPVDPLSYLPKL